MPDKTNGFARFDLEVDAPKHRIVPPVTKGDVVYFNLTLDRMSDGFVLITNRRLHINNFKNTLRCRHRLRKPPGEKADETDRPIEHPRISTKLHEFTQSQLIADNEGTT